MVTNGLDLWFSSLAPIQPKQRSNQHCRSNSCLFFSPASINLLLPNPNSTGLPTKQKSFINLWYYWGHLGTCFPVRKWKWLLWLFGLWNSLIYFFSFFPFPLSILEINIKIPSGWIPNTVSQWAFSEVKISSFLAVFIRDVKLYSSQGWRTQTPFMN